jgi:hypothetical protein
MAAQTTITISLANRSGTTATYNYAIATGAPLLVGNPIIVAGCTTASLNGNLVIASLLTSPLRFTATAGSGTIINEAETATGTVDVEALSVYPTDLGAVGSLGYCLLKRWLNGSNTDPYGNALGGANTSGLGQIFPTGLGSL